MQDLQLNPKCWVKGVNHDICITRTIHNYKNKTRLPIRYCVTCVRNHRLTSTWITQNKIHKINNKPKLNTFTTIVGIVEHLIWYTFQFLKIYKWVEIKNNRKSHLQYCYLVWNPLIPEGQIRLELERWMSLLEMQ